MLAVVLRRIPATASDKLRMQGFSDRVLTVDDEDIAATIRACG